jgi:hypothetical protein
VELRVGRERDRRRNRYQPHLVKQTRIGENIKMSAYRLSVVGSVAPPGTAWDAEGLRGNEANKNKINGTRPCASTQVAKWAGFAQEDISGSFEQLLVSGFELGALVAYRLHAGIVQVES